MNDLARQDLQQLLQSLDDLEAEYAAGDLDARDYAVLRNDYTVRVADAVRAERGDVRAPNRRSAAPTVASKRNPAAGARLAVTLGVVLLFAVGAGWLLARSTGERGVGDTLTGSIELSSRQRVLRCQELGMNDGLFLEAIQCFDEVLTSEPENVEALTYRAWFLVLASGSTEEAAADQRDELLSAAVVYLDQAITIDPRISRCSGFPSRCG